MRRMAFITAAFVIAATGSASASQVLYDPFTGRIVDLFSSGGRAAATPIPREEVAYTGKHRPGTILVDARERRL